ncbi:MAG: RluA family pseudouridine synthase [Treponema sp.]|jgi:23S rRNA pseudouridine955/2504/2580 synthase|nr:RluA family pseudouridine synthase [Treponema sp.]
MVEIKAAKDDENRRLDRILRKLFPDTPLSHIYRLMRQGNITVNGKKTSAESAQLRIMAGDGIAIPDELSAALKREKKREKERKEPSVPPRTHIRIKDEVHVIFENNDLLVVNKSAGMPVHGGASQKQKTLTEIVATYLAGTVAPSLSFTPGPLHRLDQPTSGLIVFSKTLAGARLFTELIKDHTIVKRYLAVVDGCIETPDLWQDTLVRSPKERKTLAAELGAGGLGAIRHAETGIEPLASTSAYSLILTDIRTGRTHQIRAQAALHGHPLAGDRKYGGSVLGTGLLLHAYSLEFPAETGLPALKAPLPHTFKRFIKKVFKLEDSTTALCGRPLHLLQYMKD